ncbi:hypothetical protein [Parvibacter caecicola]|uniref:Uncharacterized protein n=1 Tax=Parvibacter caecicola TaxID=747645 RepID=A0A4T9T634_9ACTN|nr:hypothetical protein [Parvibacter caecicola]TJW09732.1 hypothetical protein E5982_08770 [Parvibacter caecicola]
MVLPQGAASKSRGVSPGIPLRQPGISRIPHDAIEYALSQDAAAYRDISPKDYRLFQLADYICGIELTATKYDRNTATRTDQAFFGGSSSFKKNHLKKIRKKLLG